MKTILFIGSHFDDVEIGCAGIMRDQIINGDEIYISVLDANEGRTGSPEDRFKEQCESMDLLKLDLSNLILFNGERLHTIDGIINRLDKFKPDIIYIPWEKDTHQSHRRCFEVGQSIGRKRNITTLMYHCGSSIDFNPNLFYIIDWEKKIEILNCFRTQIDCESINIDIIKAQERYFATLISDKEDEYAEGFVVKKMRYVI
jgi:LmbE family N-acetylglucosaminyl deacetylase